MDLRLLDNDKFKNQYNALVTHVMQSWEWGEFRIKIGTPLFRYGIFKNGKMVKAFHLTLHPIPFTSQFVGYLPKGPLPDKELAEALKIIGKMQKCAFIKIEPNIPVSKAMYSIYPTFLPSPKPYFTKYNFVLDITKSEEELLKAMHPKARYNIRLAERKGVTVEERTDDKAFKMYLKLYFDTTKRQGYFGHTPEYHKNAWDTMKESGFARVLIGFYHKKPLTAWMLLSFKDTLYYPYGGSSIEHKDVMSNNLVAWEAIKLGKKLGLKKFDMWGALGPDADPKHPHFGFHQFKQRYGGELVEYLGTYDLVFDDTVYWIVTFIDKFTKLKVLLLKAIGR
jgi:lipid II:glycine glycyltransferase (peptidoglycan interpeptide bridge formation enzyme)